ncbi:23S rRNA pseudouridine(955/2504/2580) synthase RluC [Moritella viscosa]|uniref:Pseudouridine synthase n=1 Tax=Moritella viscosa TaxID=80854 RepID=A0A090IIX3_9GAMM|nr:23S rRNA pseudouridine(955/2504/2580) synthase RluC [Moritella viscosa]CED60079.1 pseudouridylate synthase [Moritella viscosa]SGY99326.1 Pseudouridine synthase [Moritella viscosa]SGZ06406.1 Pseudouridine synthase [Moritella viscosa]SGZ06588.1 Pseudouridine synthase [Moritella viscosa]SGZ14070.1 Pseudouridine synthase [Moritella viscosa]
MTDKISPKVEFVTITEDYQGQRIDNFLRTKLKGVPKSMIYRIIRKGEVRVNKGRIKPEYKLQPEDIVRVPPVRVSETEAISPSANLDSVRALESQIIYEDDYLIVINKPSGMAVHGGSGLSFGLIEGLRAIRPDSRYLELVHRLDRDTSGCLLVAKKRSTLKALHEQLRLKTMQKDYQALVAGAWPRSTKVVNAPLLKNTVSSGERIVRVDEEGKQSQTRFKIIQRYEHGTLIQASPITGRTHQIRVHTLHAGHPIACDDKYGDKDFTKHMNGLGLKRLFLHAARLKFFNPGTEETQEVEAPLDMALVRALEKLKKC